MPNDTLTHSPSIHLVLSEPELNLAEAALRRAGLMAHPHQASEREAAIQSALHKFGSRMEFTDVQLRDKSILRQLFDFLNHRFCSVADTPPHMNGIHPQTFGSPSGRWPSGNLTINVNATGCNLNTNVVTQIVLSAYAKYQAAQPFFNFTPGGPNSNIRVQFGGTNLDPKLGVPGGAIGVGGKPTTGTLYLNAGTTWTPAFLLAVVLHEAGHTLGLSHSTLSTSVMYPFAPTLNALDPETIGRKPDDRRQSAVPRIRRAGACRGDRTSAAGRALDPRDQLRWLSGPAPDRERGRQGLHPAWQRLDQAIPEDRK